MATGTSSSFAGVPATSIEIPASVEKIERNAFENLDTVIVKNSTPIAMITKTSLDGFLYTAFGLAEELSHMLLRVPKGSLEAYQNADVWKLFGTIEEYGTDSTESFEKDTTVVAEKDSTKDKMAAVARRISRYDLKTGERWFDLRGRQFKGRPKRKGFYVER